MATARVLGGLSPTRVFYGWKIAAAGAGTTFLVLGVTAYGFGVFIEQFRQEFGWSVKAIALGFSIRSLEQGFLSPFTGFFIDKIGPRRMAMAGVLMVSAGLAGMSQINSLVMYYFTAGVMAVGQSLGIWSAYNTALMRWFNKKRGRAIGVFSFGVGFGYFGALILAGMIQLFGWRETLLISSVLILLVGLPLALVIRDKPEDLGYLPDGGRLSEAIPFGANPGVALPQSLSGMEARQTARIPAFYLLAIAGAVASAGQTAFMTFQIPHLQNAGFSLGVIGLWAAFYGLGQIVFRLLMGWLGDTLGLRRVYIAGVLLMSLGLLAFSLMRPSVPWLGPLVIFVYGLGNAGWLVCSSAIIAAYFGAKRFATIQGLMAIMAVPAAIVIPIGMGAVFDSQGSYRNAYVVLGLFCLLGAVSLALIRRPLWDPNAQAEPDRKPAASPSPTAP